MQEIYSVIIRIYKLRLFKGSKQGLLKKVFIGLAKRGEGEFWERSLIKNLNSKGWGWGNG